MLAKIRLLLTPGRFQILRRRILRAHSAPAGAAGWVVPDLQTAGRYRGVWAPGRLVRPDADHRGSVFTVCHVVRYAGKPLNFAEKS